MKAEAVIAKKTLPFLFEYYNVQAFFKPGNNHLTPVLAHLVNSVVEGLNKNLKMPRYIIIIPDKDLLEGAAFDDYRINELLDDILNYLSNDIISNLETRKEDIRGKRIGGLTTTAEPRLIWVKMLVRPFIKDAKKCVFPHTRHFNDALENMVSKKRYSHILTVELQKDSANFDLSGELTTDGKIKFWTDINKQIKALDKDEIDLKLKLKTDDNHQDARDSHDHSRHRSKTHRSSRVEHGDSAERERDRKCDRDNQSQCKSSEEFDQFFKCNGFMTIFHCNHRRH